MALALWRISDLVDFNTACQGWYDFYTPGFSTQVGGSYSQVDDRSNFGRDIVQPVSSQQPNVGSINGFDMGDGNRSANRGMVHQATADVYRFAKYTIVRLIRHENLTGSNRGEYGFNQRTNGSNRRAYRERDSSTAGMRLDGSSGDAATPGGYIDTSWHLWSERFPVFPSSDQFEFKKDTLATLITDANMGFDTISDANDMDTFALYARPDNGGDFLEDHADMQVLGIAIFNRALSDAEIAQVEGMFAWDTGFENLLPAGHPYEDAAPLVDAPAAPALTSIFAANEQFGVGVLRFAAGSQTIEWTNDIDTPNWIAFTGGAFHQIEDIPDYGETLGRDGFRQQARLAVDSNEQILSDGYYVRIGSNDNEIWAYSSGPGTEFAGTYVLSRRKKGQWRPNNKADD